MAQPGEPFNIPIQAFPGGAIFHEGKLQEIAGTPANLYETLAAEQPFGISSIEGALANQPVMGEVWDVEALLLNVLVEYEHESLIVVTTPRKYLVEKIERLEKKKGQFVVQEEELTKQQANLETALAQAGKTVTENSDYSAQVFGVKSARAELNANTFGLQAEIVDIERELAALGEPQLLESFQGQPLALRGELYTPRQQLLLTSLDSFEKQIITTGPAQQEKSGAVFWISKENIVREYYAQRIEMQASPQILQNEKPKLKLSAYVAPHKGGEGIVSRVSVDLLKIAVVSASLQLSTSSSLSRHP